MASERREDVHARLIEVLPPIFRRLLTRLPNEGPGGIRFTPDQYGVLVHVAGTGPRSMGDIAAARGIALNSASALVDRLVAIGAVQRTADRADRRIVRVLPTDAGREAVAHLRELRRAALRQMLDELDEAELDAIERALPALDKLGRRAEIAAR
jgi:DNA-binding MarR family transcriptional regulator